MTFIAPGLIMMAVITNSFANVVSSFFSSNLSCISRRCSLRRCRTRRSCSVSWSAAWFADCWWPRWSRRRAVLYGPGCRASADHIHDDPADRDRFSLAGLFNAIFAKTFDDISIIPTFVLTPLTYLAASSSRSRCCRRSGRRAQLNPILYMVNAFRYGMLGSADIPIGIAYLIMFGSAAALFAAVLFMLKRGIGVRA